MNPDLTGLSLLSAMITPAVLISACGTLILSTSSRLGRVVDRVRQLSARAEHMVSKGTTTSIEEQVRHVKAQLGHYARRSRLIQAALTAFYIALGLFVAATVSIGLTGFLTSMSRVPGWLGVLGTLVLFAGCVLLIIETRSAVVSLQAEMDATIRLFDRTVSRR